MRSFQWNLIGKPRQPDKSKRYSLSEYLGEKKKILKFISYKTQDVDSSSNDEGGDESAENRKDYNWTNILEEVALKVYMKITVIDWLWEQASKLYDFTLCRL